MGGGGGVKDLTPVVKRPPPPHLSVIFFVFNVFLMQIGSSRMFAPPLQICVYTVHGWCHHRSWEGHAPPPFSNVSVFTVLPLPHLPMHWPLPLTFKFVVPPLSISRNFKFLEITLPSRLQFLQESYVVNTRYRRVGLHYSSCCYTSASLQKSVAKNLYLLITDVPNKPNQFRHVLYCAFMQESAVMQEYILRLIRALFTYLV